MSKILIADDNAHNLYLARFLLEQRGHEVSEVTDGQQAVDFVAIHDVDLVLMDMQMPVMDGLQATALIRASDKPDTRIVALTAKAMTGDREKILQAGCDGYIKKPVLPDSFAETVQTFLDRN